MSVGLVLSDKLPQVGSNSHTDLDRLDQPLYFIDEETEALNRLSDLPKITKSVDRFETQVWASGLSIIVALTPMMFLYRAILGLVQGPFLGLPWEIAWICSALVD